MKTLFVLMALCVVAMAFETEEELQADLAFIKRDAVLQDYFLSSKRGQSMRKYKPCATQLNEDQTCWCSRRGGKFAFCSGAAGGEGM
ncbi:uncharacterized protein [Diadema setosum]|uniref:uncharacterized protein n=1 Tax=Diadema setosum TaxID=31175 RepID=UPI003B3B834A